MPLDRFHEAQAQAHSGFETALGELRAGRKTSHWIWYIFPQLRGLGRSSTAQFYGLDGPSEARDFLRDPVLRERLSAATRAVQAHLARGSSLVDVMGGTIDAQKLVSSLTLFSVLAEEMTACESSGELAILATASRDVLAAAGRQGFPPCDYTLGQLRKNSVDAPQ